MHIIEFRHQFSHFNLSYLKLGLNYKHVVMEMTGLTDQRFATSTALGHEPDDDEAMWKNRALTKAISTRSGPGCLIYLGRFG